MKRQRAMDTEEMDLFKQREIEWCENLDCVGRVEDMPGGGHVNMAAESRVLRSSIVPDPMQMENYSPWTQWLFIQKSFGMEQCKDSELLEMMQNGRINTWFRTSP